ncbi:uncharacterized protein LOC130012150 [Patella vulgata]|uniref:uncharacterized protein LOC130012150 n=1 Tax=Patella vulgata TaxID=6465 RepID=UPI0024A88C0B|nr:uncharacterized protein LOC130012150 [Patella vulgata]
MLKVSTYFYLASLAIADSLVLYIGLLRIWINELTGIDAMDLTNWLCKLTCVFGYFSSDFSVWLIIAVTVERFIVVCFPFKANGMYRELENTAKFHLVKTITELLMYVNHSMNFFLYCATGRKFRQQI